MNADTLMKAHAMLMDHPLYAELNTIDRLRIFMRHHVFAVWDFFTLLKRLQAEVTTTTMPWRPAGHPEHGRFVLEIVLAEETDEDIGGGYVSHFELYRRAMDELGADPGPIDGFLADLAAGLPPMAALDSPAVPESVGRFVRHTLHVALDGAPHEVASSFCHGRENLLPDVFTAVRAHLGDALDFAPTFKHYLDRHITLDHDKHGPLALRLLDALCAGDRRREQEALQVGIEAIEARIALWDGVLADLRATEDAASIMRYPRPMYPEHAA
jgi:hypothetical protein